MRISFRTLAVIFGKEEQSYCTGGEGSAPAMFIVRKKKVNEANTEECRAKRCLITTEEHLDPTRPEELLGSSIYANKFLLP